MKKKILVSLIGMGLLVALLFGGTFAWFSDTETSKANSLETGIMNLLVNNQDNSTAPTVTLTDLKPCKPQYVNVKLSRTADSNPGVAWVHLKNVAGIIGPWTTFDLYIDDDGVTGLSDGDTCIIHPDDHMKLTDLDCVWIKIGWLEAPMKLILSFHLQGETPNSMQGQECTFDIDYKLSQDNAPPEGSKIILENKDPSNWAPILGDGKWGIAEYHASTLSVTVDAKGLPKDGTSSNPLQIAMTSPEQASYYPVSENKRVAMASALASGVYDGMNPGTAPPAGFNLFERGYNPTGSSTLYTKYIDKYQGTYVMATSFAASPSAAYANANGDLSWNGSAILPSGTYDFIKLLVKDDANPWATHLMEKDTPMSFIIP